MNFNNINISGKIVPANYIRLALESQKSSEVKIKELLEKRKLPENGWRDDVIEQTLQMIARLDSNNFEHKAGLGEREGRIVCKLVAKRHYNFGHGIGRSGDLMQAQPKAVGSTLLSQITNALLLDLIRAMGIQSCQSCFLVPMATGMTLTLCFLSIKKQRPEAKYILWSRIDQKSCFKSMTTAGFTPIIINTTRDEEAVGSLNTDLQEFEKVLNNLKSESILCIFSTTSCFAPRNMDDIIQLAKLAKKFNIPHVINNAYGLQTTYINSYIQTAQREGRVDLFVQSTDKNLMVPVGGAIVAGFDKQTVHNVAKTYAGRASSSQSLDVFMTLLSLGKNGYLNLCQDRKQKYDYLKECLISFAEENNCTVINSKRNRISIALSLDCLSNVEPTKLGSMLFTRGVSGSRVLEYGSTKVVDGFEFKNWGTHESSVKSPYLTVAATLGLTTEEIDRFMKKLQESFRDLKK